MRRLLIDITDSAASDTHHGIQRVARSFAKEGLEFSKRNDLLCVPVIFRDGAFFIADQACIDRSFQKSTSTWLQTKKRMARWLSSPGRLGATRALTRLRKLCYPKTIARKLYQLRNSFRTPPVAANPGKDDVLFLPDSWWGMPMFAAIEEARKNGAIVGTLVHDLIPMRHPELCDSRFVAMFQAWLAKAMQSMDFFIGNSETTRNDIRDYIQSTGADFANWQVRHVRLGCDIRPDSRVANAQVSLKLRTRFENQGIAPYLMVSTLEIRKNHTLVIDAFEQLWQQGSKASIAFVGRVGWKCEELLQRVINHPEYGKKLLLLADIDDSDLSYLYKSSKAFVFPSLAEGFGLPIAEAINHRLHVFASDIPIHHEVGGPNCQYFSPHDPLSLADQLQLFEATEGWKTPPPLTDLNHSWSQTFEALTEECSTIANRIYQSKAILSSNAA